MTSQPKGFAPAPRVPLCLKKKKHLNVVINTHSFSKKKKMSDSLSSTTPNVEEFGKYSVEDVIRHLQTFEWFDDAHAEIFTSQHLDGGATLLACDKGMLENILPLGTVAHIQNIVSTIVQQCKYKCECIIPF
jgi:hypothetical protein